MSSSAGPDPLPPCGGRQGWGVAQTSQGSASPRKSQGIGVTPLPNPPPQEGP